MIHAVTSWGLIADVLPDAATVESWMERALALAAPDTVAHALTLSARALWDPQHLATLAPQALAAAERSGDLNAIGNAYGMQECLAGIERRYADALQWAPKRLALLDQSDPYQIGDTYLHFVVPLMALGRFTEARQYAARNEEIAPRQSEAWRARAIAWWIELESLAAEWHRVRQYEARAREAMRDASADSPTVYNVRALLLCAAARAHLGDPDEADTLDRLATDLAGAADDDRIVGPYIRLALARRDLSRVADLMTQAPTRLRPWAQWWSIDLAATRLEALAALGNTAALEAEAAPFIGTNTFAEAVAVRALGLVRHDPMLLLQATDMFAGMDLPAQAAQTKRLAGRIEPGNDQQFDSGDPHR